MENILHICTCRVGKNIQPLKMRRFCGDKLDKLASHNRERSRHSGAKDQDGPEEEEKEEERKGLPVGPLLLEYQSAAGRRQQSAADSPRGACRTQSSLAEGPVGSALLEELALLERWRAEAKGQRSASSNLSGPASQQDEEEEAEECDFEYECDEEDGDRDDEERQLFAPHQPAIDFRPRGRVGAPTGERPVRGELVSGWAGELGRLQLGGYALGGVQSCIGGQRAAPGAGASTNATFGSSYISSDDYNKANFGDNKCKNRQSKFGPNGRHSTGAFGQPMRPDYAALELGLDARREDNVYTEGVAQIRSEHEGGTNGACELDDDNNIYDIYTTSAHDKSSVAPVEVGEFEGGAAAREEEEPSVGAELGLGGNINGRAKMLSKASSSVPLAARRRANLRKQTSESRHLDSCGSSDSGQGTTRTTTTSSGSLVVAGTPRASATGTGAELGLAESGLDTRLHETGGGSASSRANGAARVTQPDTVSGEAVADNPHCPCASQVGVARPEAGEKFPERLRCGRPPESRGSELPLECTREPRDSAGHHRKESRPERAQRAPFRPPEETGEPGGTVAGRGRPRASGPKWSRSSSRLLSWAEACSWSAGSSWCSSPLSGADSSGAWEPLLRGPGCVCGPAANPHQRPPAPADRPRPAADRKPGSSSSSSSSPSSSSSSSASASASASAKAGPKVAPKRDSSVHSKEQSPADEEPRAPLNYESFWWAPEGERAAREGAIGRPSSAPGGPRDGPSRPAPNDCSAPQTDCDRSSAGAPTPRAPELTIRGQIKLLDCFRPAGRLFGGRRRSAGDQDDHYGAADELVLVCLRAEGEAGCLRRLLARRAPDSRPQLWASLQLWSSGQLQALGGASELASRPGRPARAKARRASGPEAAPGRPLFLAEEARQDKGRLAADCPRACRSSNSSSSPCSSRAPSSPAASSPAASSPGPPFRRLSSFSSSLGSSAASSPVSSQAGSLEGLSSARRSRQEQHEHAHFWRLVASTSSTSDSAAEDSSPEAAPPSSSGRSSAGLEALGVAGSGEANTAQQLLGAPPSQQEGPQIGPLERAARQEVATPSSPLADLRAPCATQSACPIGELIERAARHQGAPQLLVGGLEEARMLLAADANERSAPCDLERQQPLDALLRLQSIDEIEEAAGPQLAPAPKSAGAKLLVRSFSVHSSQSGSSSDSGPEERHFRSPSAAPKSPEETLSTCRLEMDSKRPQEPSPKRTNRITNTDPSPALPHTEGACHSDSKPEEPTSEQDDNDDDDYFYDDDLSLFGPAGHASNRHPEQSSLGPPLEGPRGSDRPPADTPPRHAGLPVGGRACQRLAAALAGGAQVATADGLEQVGSADALLGQLSALAGTRPLIIWAPSARRVSCPVLGGSGARSLEQSYASWRQLWPALPPPPSELAGPLSGPNTAPGQPLCARCGAAGAEQAQGRGCGQSRWLPSPPLWEAAAAAAVGGGQQWASQCESNKWSRSSLAACSDYFSSFDQSAAGGQTSLGGGWLQEGVAAGGPQLSSPAASHGLLAADSVCSMGGSQQSLPVTSSRGSLCQRAGSQRRRPPPTGAQPQPPATATGGHALPPLELRRQSTITGFHHHRYQAPRSPSLCLPGPGRGGRLRAAGSGGHTTAGSSSSSSAAHLAVGRGATGASGRLLLSPTHSTGGSSGSPSPTGWQQGAQLLVAAQQQQQQYQLCQGASSGQQRGAPANNFGRPRLQSLESDRGSSPSWSASSSSLRSSVGAAGPLSLGSIHSLGAAACQSGCPPTGRAKCAHCSAQLLQQLRHEILLADKPAKPPPLPGHPGGPGPAHPARWQARPPAGPPLARPWPQRRVSASGQVAAGQLGGALGHTGGPAALLGPQHQQQAVYFFLCCCQRGRTNRRDSADSGPDAHTPLQPAAAAPPVRQPPPGQTSGPTPPEPRRASLVARSAIVGLDEASPPAGRLARATAARNQQVGVAAGLATELGASSGSPGGLPSASSSSAAGSCSLVARAQGGPEVASSAADRQQQEKGSLRGAALEEGQPEDEVAEPPKQRQDPDEDREVSSALVRLCFRASSMGTCISGQLRPFGQHEVRS